MRTNRLAAFVAAPLLAAVTSAYAGVQNNALTLNALTANALSGNGLSFNALTTNSLSLNALTLERPHL
jgi:hypothetical protein